MNDGIFIFGILSVIAAKYLYDFYIINDMFGVILGIITLLLGLLIVGILLNERSID